MTAVALFSGQCYETLISDNIMKHTHTHTYTHIHVGHLTLGLAPPPTPSGAAAGTVENLDWMEKMSRQPEQSCHSHIGQVGIGKW